MLTNNLNLSLHFDPFKKFLICGELVKFNLKITSPDFGDDINEFVERIGAAVEAIEIVEESNMSLSNSSISESYSKGRKMKSVESLSNLLRATTLTSSGSSSSDSQRSMSSVTARRFNSLSQNRSSETKAFWDPSDRSIIVPLEAFIDSECLSVTCRKGTVKFKISLNELVPISDDIVAYSKRMDGAASVAQSSHRLQKIGQAEMSFPVLRPLEVSLRTHSLSPTQVLLQINLEYEAESLEGLLGIDKVDIVLSDSFTSRTQKSAQFRISPLSESQVPFVFETSPQQRSLLYNWTLLTPCDLIEDLNDFHLRVELFGKLLTTSVDPSEISLSFESSLPIYNLFPKIEHSGVEITSTKLKNSEALRVFEPFQVELILHNYEASSVSLTLNIVDPQKSETQKTPRTESNPIQEWFQMERRRKTPGLLLMSPLTPLKVENLPPGGSKSIRLQFVPAKQGIFNLKNEFKIQETGSGKVMKFKDIIIKVE